MANEAHLKREGEFTYIDVGDGPPLIFLHGLFGALSNFEGPIKHFGGRYRVLMPMLPLYTLPMLNTNVPALADFLDRFASRFALAHLKDVSAAGAEIDTPEFGQGVFEAYPYLAFLRARRPDLPIILEHLPFDHIPTAIERIHQVLAHSNQ